MFYYHFPELLDAFNLRNAFVPYLYTEAYDAYQTGVAPIHGYRALSVSVWLPRLPSYVVRLSTSLLKQRLQHVCELAFGGERILLGSSVLLWIIRCRVAYLHNGFRADEHHR